MDTTKICLGTTCPPLEGDVAKGDSGSVMCLPYKRELIPRAKELRKEMTPQERKLWYLFLRIYPVRFQRQKTIGSFIVDFYCAKARLFIEVDGGPHFTDHGIACDKDREVLLRKFYIDIIRFTNNDVDYKFDEVCENINKIVKSKIDAPPVALRRHPPREGDKLL